MEKNMYYVIYFLNRMGVVLLILDKNDFKNKF